MPDKFVLDFLSENEKIQAELIEFSFITFWRKITWLASNKRILKYDNNLFFGKSIQDLDYKNIVSIERREVRPFIILILGLIIFIYISFFSPQVQNPILIKILAIIVFINALIIFFTKKSIIVQFNAPGINPSQWRVNRKYPDSRIFIKIVRKNCFFDKG